MDRNRIREYLFCAVCTVLLVFALLNFKYLYQGIIYVLKILSPIMIGGALAFVLTKPFNMLEQLYRKLFPKIKDGKAANVLALLSVYIILFGAITLIFWFIIPQLSQSINILISNLDSYYNNLRVVVDNISKVINYDIWNEFNITEQITKLSKGLPTMLGQIFPSIFVFTTSVIGRITDIVLGLVLSVYLLLEKRKLAVQANSLMRAFLPHNICDKAVDLLKLASRNFSNFISGQLTDALVLGVLCFIGMNIFKFEYAFLISVIIAITNVIPIVGPIIGSVPSTFILLLVNPAHAFWFVIFIIVLQQIEANLIYPKIVGESVGLPAIWVLIAVIVGGGIFGVWGMILGIPTMSIFYELLRNKIRGEEIVPKIEDE